MTWRFGMATGYDIGRPVGEALALFARAGITSVEVSTPPGHFDLWQREQVAETGRRLTHLGIEPVSIHAPFGESYDLSDPDSRHRAAAIGSILAAASAVRELGGFRVVTHTTDVPRHGQDVGERLRLCLSSIATAAQACHFMGVALIVETPLPHLIGGDPEEFGWLLRHLEPRVGVCIDTGHVSLGRHWDAFVRVAGRRLIHIHASDNHGQYDDHLPPGEGSIDWSHIRESLLSAEFDGWIMLEVSQPGLEAPDALRGAMCRARELLEGNQELP